MELPKSAANLYIPSATLHLRYYARAIPSRDAFYVEIGLCIGELLHALRQAAFWRAINPLLEDAFLQIEARAQARVATRRKAYELSGFGESCFGALIGGWRNHGSRRPIVALETFPEHLTPLTVT